MCSSHRARVEHTLHKGTNLAGIDPETSVLIDLFHPSCHNWSDHFDWQGITLVVPLLAWLRFALE
jgi:hypothetical protein